MPEVIATATLGRIGLTTDLAKLADRISEIERFKDKPVIVCCASGMRSGKACGELRKLGFAKIHNLSGGIDAWVGAGYPVKKGTRNR